MILSYQPLEPFFSLLFQCHSTLVYLDPVLQVRASTYSALVWAINGISSGWKQPVEVSLSLLQEVVKAVLPSQNQDSGQQMGLL